jgi:hypothetical protein
MDSNINSSGFNDGHVSSGADDHHLTEHHHKLHLHRIANSPHLVKDIIEAGEATINAYEDYLLDRIGQLELAKVMTTLYRLLPMSIQEPEREAIPIGTFGMGKCQSTLRFLIEQELKRKRA